MDPKKDRLQEKVYRKTDRQTDRQTDGQTGERMGGRKAIGIELRSPPFTVVAEVLLRAPPRKRGDGKLGQAAFPYFLRQSQEQIENYFS